MRQIGLFFACELFVLRSDMGDLVAKMLGRTLDVFRHDDRKLLREIEQMDDGVDALHEAIKLYLTEVSRESMDARDHRTRLPRRTGAGILPESLNRYT